MKIKHFWKLEYTITLLVLFTVGVLMLPTSMQSTRQAILITKWNDCLSKLYYMKDVITTHEEENMLAQLKRTTDKAEREKIITLIIKPYFRLTEHKYLKHYEPKYMNGTKAKVDDTYYFSDLYKGDKNLIVGIKDIKDETTDSAMFMMMFDVNGLLPPNTWGKDIFGTKVFSNRIDPIGKSLSLDEMKEDCSPNGKGISCSYYYRIGGNFVE